MFWSILNICHVTTMWEKAMIRTQAWCGGSSNSSTEKYAMHFTVYKLGKTNKKYFLSHKTSTTTIMPLKGCMHSGGHGLCIPGLVSLSLMRTTFRTYSNIHTGQTGPWLADKLILYHHLHLRAQMGLPVLEIQIKINLQISTLNTEELFNLYISNADDSSKILLKIKLIIINY